MTSTAGFPIAAALLVAALLAGCGGSSGAGVTHQAFHTALQAAACMRANGVPNYPEPELINGTVRISFTARINPTTPAVQPAAKKCGSQNELQAEETRSRIGFAHCMRANGVPNFPDPQLVGSGANATIRLPLGNLPESPFYQRAAKKCKAPSAFDGG